MKKLFLYIFTMALAVSSCARLDEPGCASSPLSIECTCRAFNAMDPTGVSTKASVNDGVTTSFAVGDDMGVFGVMADGTIVYDNLRFALYRNGLWERVDADGRNIASEMLNTSGLTYFAYAPYSNDFDHCGSVDAIILKYKELYPVKHAVQNTKAEYNSADLLVSESSVAPVDATVRFNFSHAMAQLKVFYNGDYSTLHVQHPVSCDDMYLVSKTYYYIAIPSNQYYVYGTADAKTIYNGAEIESPAYWQAKVKMNAGESTYITISGAPTESYKSSGVDMGFESGCVWSNHNLGTQSLETFNARNGKWYDENGNVIDQNTASFDGLPLKDFHQYFDRGDYYSWGELHTKYEQPAVILNADGSIKNVGENFTYASDGVTINGVTAFTPGSYKGYFVGTYIDNHYTFAQIDGNIAGSENDVVRSELWKGEWRLPNEDEIEELIQTSDVSVVAWYYEDNVRYAPWLAEKNADGTYKNLNKNNSRNWGTAEVEPTRYLVAVFKFKSKVNGNVIYFTGGSWTDWSIDILANTSRDRPYGNNGNNNADRDANGGMFYFASSASHADPTCCSYMYYPVNKTWSGGKIQSITPKIVSPYQYTDKNGELHTLHQLNQLGHRYTGMFIRPVYGGTNWDTTTKSIVITPRKR